MFQEHVAVIRRISLSRLGTLTRRRAVCIGAAAGLATFAEAPARAYFLQHPVLEIFQPGPIALPDFLAGSPADAEPARAISQIIATDLKRSGVVVPIDQATFIEKIVNIDVLPQFADWRAIKAEELVTGRVTSQPDARIKVEFRLWDVFGGVQLGGMQYLSTPDDFRRIAHMISDAIYERLTGKTGNFGSSTSP
jgi:TolB protein